MGDQPKPQSAYATKTEWFADLDHSTCFQDREGNCHGYHCPHCGDSVGSGWAPCPCTKASTTQ